MKKNPKKTGATGCFISVRVQAVLKFLIVAKKFGLYKTLN